MHLFNEGKLGKGHPVFEHRHDAASGGVIAWRPAASQRLSGKPIDAPRWPLGCFRMGFWEPSQLTSAGRTAKTFGARACPHNPPPSSGVLGSALFPRLF